MVFSALIGWAVLFDNLGGDIVDRRVAQYDYGFGSTRSIFVWTLYLACEVLCFFEDLL